MSESIDEMRARLRRLEATLATAAMREQLAIAVLHERKAALIRGEVDHATAQNEHHALRVQHMELSNRLHTLECPTCSSLHHRTPVN